MTPTPNAQTHGAQRMREYASYGSILGGALGIIAGVIVSGPHFSEWSAVTSVGLILACGAGGALIGYLAPSMALGSPASLRGGSSSAGVPSVDGDCADGSAGDSGCCSGDGGGD